MSDASGSSVLDRIVRFSVCRATLVILAAAGMTILAGLATMRVGADFDFGRIAPLNAEASQLANLYGRGGERQSLIMVAATSPTPFDPASLTALHAMTELIEALPDVGLSTTPFNAITLERHGGLVRVAPPTIQRGAPVTTAQAAALRSRLEASVLASNMVVSADATTLTAFFWLDEGAPTDGIAAEIEALVHPLRQHYDVALGGSTTFNERALVYIRKEAPLLLLAALLAIATTQFLAYRSLWTTALVLITAGMATVWTVGSMALLGIKFSLVTILVPPLVLTLGSSYAIHFVNDRYRRMCMERGESRVSTQESSSTRRAIFLSAVTTVVGLASLLVTSFLQVRVFAVVLAIGIAYDLLLASMFLPAVMSKGRRPGSLPVRLREFSGVSRTECSGSGGWRRWRSSRSSRASSSPCHYSASKQMWWSSSQRTTASSRKTERS